MLMIMSYSTKHANFELEVQCPLKNVRYQNTILEPTWNAKKLLHTDR